MSEERERRDDRPSEERGFVPPKPPTPNPKALPNGEEGHGSGDTSGESQSGSEPKEDPKTKPSDGE